MNKEIRKCFRHLGLPYNASIEDLEEKEHALIKYYKDKEKTGENHNEDIAFVRIASDKLREYIDAKGNSNTHFITKPADIGTLLFILLILSCSVLVSVLALL